MAARLQQCQMPFRPARANNWKISNFSTVVKFTASDGAGWYGWKDGRMGELQKRQDLKLEQLRQVQTGSEQEYQKETETPESLVRLQNFARPIHRWLSWNAILLLIPILILAMAMGIYRGGMAVTLVLPSAVDGHSSWQLAFCVANVYLSPEFFPFFPLLPILSSWSSWSSVIAAEVQLHKLLNTIPTVESQCIELCCPFLLFVLSFPGHRRHLCQMLM